MSHGLSQNPSKEQILKMQKQAREQLELEVMRLRDFCCCLVAKNNEFDLAMAYLGVVQVYMDKAISKEQFSMGY